MRHLQIARPEQTVLLIVDIQQKLFDLMKKKKHVTHHVKVLTEAAKTLDLPIVVTEQYRKGLGPTEPAIAEAIENFSPLEKMTFSCMGNDAIVAELKRLARPRVIVTGIETHICVQQTVLDLIQADYTVYLPADATCSRAKANYKTGVERMRAAGAVITTTESMVFELLEEAGTDRFKALLPLFK